MTHGVAACTNPVASTREWATRFENPVGPTADALERGDARLLLARQAEGQELEQRATELLSRNDPIALAAVARSFKAVQLINAEIASLKMPILVIVGSEDLAESRVKAFEGLQPTLETVVIDRATHAGAGGALRRVEFSDSLRVFLLKHSSR